MTPYNKLKFGITSISLLIGMFIPIFLYFFGGGLEPSFSSYYETDAKWWLFGLLLITSIGFFMGKDEWKISGALLIGIAIFDVSYPMLHNVIAGTFFLYTGVIMALDKRFYLLAVPIFLSGLSIPFQGLYIFEFISLWCVASFNGLYMLRFLRVLNIK